MVELPGMRVVCWESCRAPSEGSLRGAKLPQSKVVGARLHTVPWMLLHTDYWMLS